MWRIYLDTVATEVLNLRTIVKEFVDNLDDIEALYPGEDFGF